MTSAFSINKLRLIITDNFISSDLFTTVKSISHIKQTHIFKIIVYKPISGLLLLDNFPTNIVYILMNVGHKLTEVFFNRFISTSKAFKVQFDLRKPFMVLTKSKLCIKHYTNTQ